MQGSGYPLYSDVGHRYLDKLSEVKPSRLSKEHIQHADPFIQLHYISNQLARHSTNMSRTEKYEAVGFHDDDRLSVHDATVRGADIFNEGISDLELPFHFIPALLQDMLLAAKDRLKLSEDELREFNMTDFAGIIREQWFLDILSDTAKTTNGLWGESGKYQLDPENLHPIHQASGFSGKPHEVYEVEFYTDPDFAPLQIANISLAAVFKLNLVSKLRGKDSVGCPVAAKSRSVDPKNPHTENLVRSSHLELQTKESGAIIGRQSTTPIERSALVLADFLHKYVEKYGEPNGR